MAKTGAAGFAMNLTSDVSMGGINESHFFSSSSGPKAGMSKRQKRQLQLDEMARTGRDAMGLPLGYSAHNAVIKQAQRHEAGKVGKDPFAGSSGQNVFGEASKKPQKVYATMEDVLKNPHKYGAQAVKQEKDLAIKEDNTRDGGAIVLGLLQGKDDMKELAKSTGVGILMEAVESKSDDAKRQVISTATSGEEKHKLEKKVLAPAAPKPPTTGQRSEKDSDRWN
jgi:hypothetical protein